MPGWALPGWLRPYLAGGWLGLALAGCHRPLWPGLGQAGATQHTAHTLTKLTVTDVEDVVAVAATTAAVVARRT